MGGKLIVRSSVRSRGFSLIEMMLVIAILAVLAALAVPAMSPRIDEAELSGTADGVAALLWRAQAEAMATKRCVRVRIEGTEIVAERLNAYDCDVSPATAPLIDTTAARWIEVARFRLDGSLMTATFDPVPAGTSASSTGANNDEGVDQIRFRPSGRLFSRDDDPENDDGVIKITHTRMAENFVHNSKKILVEAQGLVCVLPRGVDPTGSGNNLSCP